ncbi:MAG: VWA domain-containing protein [Saprospiraceae bacterium]
MIGWFNNLIFSYPWLLLLLALLPVGVWLYRRNRARRYPDLRLPSLRGLPTVGSWRGRVRPVLPLLRLAAAALFIIALARPRLDLSEENVTAEGIDIILAMDLSSSMLAQDFPPNRLEVSKQVAINFVNNRQHDRIGLVVFSGEAFTQSPLTTDYDVVKYFLERLKPGVLDDGTAIGTGLATSVNRLRDSEAESKVIILLTDGVNNTGYQSPELATQLAKEFDIRVYTVGVGTTGEVLAPVSQRSNGQYIYGVARGEIDENLLQFIADQTNGRYFRAKSAGQLEEIYEYINELETTEILTTVVKRYSEQFHWFLGWGLLLLLIELGLRYTVLRAIP